MANNTQIETTMRYDFTLTRMAIIKRQTINTGKSEKKLKYLYIGVIKVKWYSHFGKWFRSSSKATGSYSMTQQFHS